MSNQNDFFWCCFPAFETVTHFMLFCLVNRCFFWMPSFYQKWRGVVLPGWHFREVNKIAHLCHDLRALREKCSAARDDQRAQYYRFGITFAIWGRELTKSNLSSILSILHLTKIWHMVPAVPKDIYKYLIHSRKLQMSQEPRL